MFEDVLRAVWHACLQQRHVTSVCLVHDYLGCAASSMLGALTSWSGGLAGSAHEVFLSEVEL